MSAFLGPIHFWVYNKIQVQQSIVEEIIKSGEKIAPELRDNLDQSYGVSETRPLEEVIDEGNIHGWLQQHVSQVEYKLAYSITYLMKKDLSMQQKFEEIFRRNGEEISATVTINHAREAYKIINDSLLDGMPCDHANTVLEENEDRVVWRRNQCVHKDYWEKVGGDINLYYSFRDSFIRGILSNTQLCYEKVDNVTSMISKNEE